MAHWHGLAKLRLHTDHSLACLDKVTIAIGEQLRHFQRVTCAKFQTRETQREAEARRRRAAKRDGTGPQKKGNDTKKAPDSRRPKLFNLNTYKTHALGDYANTIREYGTTDSFSTELVSYTLISSVILKTTARENWSIEHQSPDIQEQAASFLSSNCLRSSAGKIVFVS